MNNFTLIMAYYENRGMLLEQANRINKLPPYIRQSLSLIVVDDGSPENYAFNALPDSAWIELKINLASVQLWRMLEDVRWNQDACRNLAMRETRTQWNLLTDMDHVVPEKTWRWLIDSKLDKHRAFRFGRVDAPALTPYKPHPNSYAMTRTIYWDCGGYDEALRGNYGTDGDFLVRLRRTAPVDQLVDQVLIRFPREVIPDASTTSLTRKSEEDKERVKRIIKARDINGGKIYHFQTQAERLI